MVFGSPMIAADFTSASRVRRAMFSCSAWLALGDCSRAYLKTLGISWGRLSVESVVAEMKYQLLAGSPLYDLILLSSSLVRMEGRAILVERTDFISVVKNHLKVLTNTSNTLRYASMYERESS